MAQTPNADYTHSVCRFHAEHVQDVEDSGPAAHQSGGLPVRDARRYLVGETFLKWDVRGHRTDIWLAESIEGPGWTKDFETLETVGACAAAGSLISKSDVVVTVGDVGIRLDEILDAVQAGLMLTP